MTGEGDRVPEVKWLAECSVAALREALAAVAPELSGYPLTVPGPLGKQDPLYHSGSEPLGDRFIVKFAWSRPAALRLAREIAVLTALGREPKVPFLPEVVVASTDPVLTRHPGKGSVANPRSRVMRWAGVVPAHWRGSGLSRQFKTGIRSGPARQRAGPECPVSSRRFTLRQREAPRARRDRCRARAAAPRARPPWPAAVRPPRPRSQRPRRPQRPPRPQRPRRPQRPPRSQRPRRPHPQPHAQ